MRLINRILAERLTRLESSKLPSVRNVGFFSAERPRTFSALNTVEATCYARFWCKPL